MFAYFVRSFETLAGRGLKSANNFFDQVHTLSWQFMLLFSGLVFAYPIHSAAVLKVKPSVNLSGMICLELVEEIC